MAVDMAKIKELREKTNVGIIDCKKALQETGGDIEKAVEFLRKKGMKTADKKSSRSTSEGVIGHYIHSNNKIGVMVELQCETDFVARTPEFQELSKNLCMHVAAANPMALSPADIPASVVKKEEAIFREEMKDKPDNIIDNIIKGKMNKFYQDNCLMNQIYVKDPKGKQTVETLIKEQIATLGENIQLTRFVRFELGEKVATQPEAAKEAKSEDKGEKKEKKSAKKSTKKSAKGKGKSKGKKKKKKKK